MGAAGKEKLGQTTAILYLLGHEHGYLADGAEDTYLMQYAICCYDDFYSKGTIYYNFKEEATEEMQATHKQHAETCMTKLDESLKKVGKKYLAGDKITIADFVCYSWLSTNVGNPVVKHESLVKIIQDFLESKEDLKKWFTMMCEENKTYLENRLASPF